LIPAFSWSVGKMESPNPRSRFEELKLLYQRITETEQGYSIWEQENAKKGKLMQVVQKELRELKISIALVQLDLVASPEITEKVSSLTAEGNTQDLLNLILDMVSDLEKYVAIDRTKPDMAYIKRSVKTLAILTELLASLD